MRTTLTSVDDTPIFSLEIKFITWHLLLVVAKYGYMIIFLRTCGLFSVIQRQLALCIDNSLCFVFPISNLPPPSFDSLVCQGKLEDLKNSEKGIYFSSFPLSLPPFTTLYSTSLSPLPFPSLPLTLILLTP